MKIIEKMKVNENGMTRGRSKEESADALLMRRGLGSPAPPRRLLLCPKFLAALD